MKKRTYSVQGECLYGEKVAGDELFLVMGYQVSPTAAAPFGCRDDMVTLEHIPYGGLRHSETQLG
jgi:hypothetical protein